MTLLSDIVNEIEFIKTVGSLDRSITGLAIDSRKVEIDCLFAAIPGSQLDGHEFIQNAIEAGANSIVCERLPDTVLDSVTYLQVASANIALARIARAYFEYPDEDMIIVGVTGTNGKTTVATMAWQLAGHLGLTAGLFSTVDVRIGNDRVSATHTTPDLIQLYGRLHEMKQVNCTHVFMEVSSHALDQNRVAGLNFDVAVFTNASRDHLDYHGDFKAYLNAKKLLFDGLEKDATAIICADDKHADYMVQNCKARKLTYGLRSFGDLHGRIIENSIDGLTLQLNGMEIVFRIAGEYNAQNLLAAFGIFQALEFEPDMVLEKWSLLTGAEGRFSTMKNKDGVTAIVDYAHSPDALKNVLQTINKIRNKNQSLITVIGCGGDRDTGKRPMMARIATVESTMTVLTSDNPRSESPEAIIEDMYAGVDEVDQKNTFKITSREEAIKLACQLAREGDIILVAGKGHEKYQEINGEKFPFDDKQVLQQYLSIS